MYLNNKEIIEVLEEYINNPKKQYAILIDGEWGCGKTHFIKNEYIKKEDANKVYISLYGVKSKEEINKKIYYAIIDKKIKINKKVKKLGEETGKIAEITIENIFNIKLGGIKNIDISGIVSLFNDIKKYVLIFDDLERCDISINEVLGYINEYVEHKNVKVIIIANENEINKLNFDTNYELKVMSCLNNNLDFKEDNKTKNQAMSSDNNKITLE